MLSAVLTLILLTALVATDPATGEEGEAYD